MESNASRNACVPVLSLSSVLSAVFFAFFCVLLRRAPVPLRLVALLVALVALLGRVAGFTAAATDCQRTMTLSR